MPVDDNVHLEVLDWGGTGRPLVVLARLGDTAHVHDDFAPKLTAKYRIQEGVGEPSARRYALRRRAANSRPERPAPRIPKVEGSGTEEEPALPTTLNNMWLPVVVKVVKFVAGA